MTTFARNYGFTVAAVILASIGLILNADTNSDQKRQGDQITILQESPCTADPGSARCAEVRRRIALSEPLSNACITVQRTGLNPPNCHRDFTRPGRSDSPTGGEPAGGDGGSPGAADQGDPSAISPPAAHGGPPGGGSEPPGTGSPAGTPSSPDPSPAAPGPAPSSSQGVTGSLGQVLDDVGQTAATAVSGVGQTVHDTTCVLSELGVRICTP